MLMRAVAIIALFCAANALLGGAHKGIWPVSQAQAREVATLKLLFGSTWMTVERHLIDYQSSARQLRDVAWSNAPKYEVSYPQVVELRFAEIIPAELPCREYLKLTFLQPKRLVQVVPIPPIYHAWDQVRMENPEIVKFTTPSGSNEKIDYYEFESDDLRNYLGRKQAFIDAKNVFPDTP
jgi:hypothetical protein